MAKVTPSTVRYKLAVDSQEERTKIREELVTHLAKGLSIDSYIGLSKNHMKKLVDLYQQEFVGDDIDQAIQQGLLYWEELGRSQADGSCLGNSRTWYYNMSNRYGWSERSEVKSESKHNHTVNVVKYE